MNINWISHKTFRQRTLRSLNIISQKRDEYKLLTVGVRLFLIQLRYHPMVTLGLLFALLSQLKKFRSPLFLRILFRGKKHVHLPGHLRRHSPRLVEDKRISTYWRRG